MKTQDRLAPLAFAAPVTFGSLSEGVRAFSGVAYAGGIVTDHPFFDAVAFDLATTRFATPAPALLNHRESVGVIKDAQVSDRIEINGTLFADMDGGGKEIAQKADRGFPWQMSVGIWPGRIEEVKAGASVKLNGRTMPGPLVVFRDNRIRETSFVALGADGSTSAQIFTVSEGGTRPPVIQSNEGTNMETIPREEHNRLMAELQGRLDAQTTANQAATTRIAALEQAEAARTKDARLSAIRELFTATGREFKDEAAAPYLAMDEATFAAVAKDLKAGRAAIDPKLFQTQATGGAPAPDTGAPETAEAIQEKAAKFMADQAALGRKVSVSQAVAHVTAKAAA